MTLRRRLSRKDPPQRLVCQGDAEDFEAQLLQLRHQCGRLVAEEVGRDLDEERRVVATRERLPGSFEDPRLRTLDVELDHEAAQLGARKLVVDARQLCGFGADARVAGE